MVTVLLIACAGAVEATPGGAIEGSTGPGLAALFANTSSLGDMVKDVAVAPLVGSCGLVVVQVFGTTKGSIGLSTGGTRGVSIVDPSTVGVN